VADQVLHAGELRTIAQPMPGEIWLRDAGEVPVIITAITLGRVSWIQPSTRGDRDEGEPYRTGYCGSAYFFAEEWTRMWPPESRRG
jgi:hypothetical protein